MVGQAQDRAGPRQGLGLPGYGLKAKTVVSSWERDGRWRLGDWDVGRLETGLSACLSVCRCGGRLDAPEDGWLQPAKGQSARGKQGPPVSALGSINAEVAGVP